MKSILVAIVEIDRNEKNSVLGFCLSDLFKTVCLEREREERNRVLAPFDFGEAPQ